MCFMLLVSCGAQNSTDDLKNIDLERIVLQTDDLPPEVLQNTHMNKPVFVSTDPTIVKAYQQLIVQDNGSVIGQVTVFLYRDASDATKKYNETIAMVVEPLRAQFPTESPSVGEQALLQKVRDSTSINFTRCHAYVDITLTVPADVMVAYSTRLDTRLATVACP